MRLSVQTSIPLGSPDTLIATNPPGSGLLPSSKDLNLWLHASAGSASVRPYSWKHGRWVGLGSDAVAGVGPDPVTATAGVNGSVSEGRYKGVGEGRYWCLVREAGAGTIDEAHLDPVDR